MITKNEVLPVFFEQKLYFGKNVTVLLVDVLEHHDVRDDLVLWDLKVNAVPFF